MAEYTDNYGLIEPTYAELADIDPLNGNFETIDEIMHASQVSLADAYDLTATYNTGDVVMYQYLMYKCKEDNVTGAWDATKWERTTAGANGSGGGGTEVVANPVGTPTEDLQTIKIAGTIYDIPGGGGSGGGGNFKITNLWNYADDNSGVIPYDVFGPFTLHESITNYDAVFLELISDAGDLSNQWRGSAFTPLYFINALQSEYEPYNINFTSYDQRSSHYVITGNTIQCTIGSGGSLNGLVNVWGVKFAGSGAVSAEVIPIGIGDGTNSRTFQLNKTPKSIIMQGYTNGDGGWYESGYFVWGSNFMNLVGAQYTIATGGYAGQAAISYGADGKSFTITAANAFGAFNRADSFSGFLFVDYGEGGEGSDNLADMTWTLLASTTSTSQAETIPGNTKWLVVTAEFGGTEVALVAKESISNINKIMELSQLSKFILSGAWRNSAGNNATPSAEISNGQVVAVSSYHTVTTKVYAVS